MTNHEANFMKALVECKAKMGSDVILFEWDVENNRWKSDAVYTAWCAYSKFLLGITGKKI